VPITFLRTCTNVAIFSFLCGCATVPRPTVAYRLSEPPKGIVLVADGAGGVPEALHALEEAVKETRAPLYIRSFDWTHGQGRGVRDMADAEHSRAQGRRLAAEIAWYRGACPSTPVYVLAYSAGTHVALEAARWLPPDSLERIVLLAPAVAADYDLRPPLAAARQGVDAFTSDRDRFYLGIGTRVVGTADGKNGVPPAGRVGFDVPPVAGPTDACLLRRLRQHPWEPSVAWSGNTGTHSGSLAPQYFRAYVLPLLTTPSR
jgi:pimeloyl-ACP methyl ester carboxylesterase